MPLTSGTKLGPYEIREQIGAGGMGEVYSATDTRLDRTVAIKVLPEDLAEDPTRRERFEREAKAVSSLNHPHICTLYDVGEQDGTHYLVMELVEGDTLVAKLEKGRLPLDQALEYAIQIADALDKAHRQGVVHRDLKPGNIMLTQTGVKLLDFGLAKLKGDTGPASTLSQTATEDASKPLTAEGTILGTLQYMAPEQLEGKDADARTDIFAFGAVVYEMVTGKKAFEGKSQASLIAAIIEREPQPMTDLQSMTPRALDHVVRTCLAKDPEGRWQTSRDFCREIEWIRKGGSQVAVPPSETLERRPAPRIGMLGFVAVLIALAAVLYILRIPPTDVRLQLEVVTPFTDEASSLAISPDGLQIAFVARSEGVSQLWLRSLETGESRPLPGTRSARMPFWSPDNRSVGFFASGQLKRLDLAGGSVQILASLLAPAGGSWGDNDEILYGAVGGIYSIPASAGERTLVLAPEDAPHDYRFPQWLPGNNAFVYWGQGGSDNRSAALYLSSVDGTVNQQLTTSDSGAIYLASGHLAFVLGGTLFLQEFNPGAYAMVGDPTPLAGVVVNFWGNTAVSGSTDGTLVYRATGDAGRQTLVRLDRAGNTLATLAPDVETPAEPELSPSGDRIAVTSVDSQGLADIWVIDETSGSSQRMTTNRSDDFWPVWSPDGNVIVFGTWRNYESKINNESEIWSLASDQSSPAETLEPNGSAPTDWSPDGDFLLYYVLREYTDFDLWVRTLAGDQAPRPVADSRFNETHGQFSPDGRWIAFHSDESGRSEIHVTPFPGPGGVQVISTSGGIQPRWRGDGEELELFFLRPDNMLMAVRLQPSADGSRLIPGTPEELFVTEIAGGAAQPFDFKQFYDVAPDGQSFVMAVTPEDQTTEPITVILNWEAGIEP